MKRAVLLVLSLLALAATGSCGVFSADPVTVQAQFKNSVGLYEGNTVAVLGITIGKVTEIRPQGTHVLATLEIDPDVAVPAEAVAALVSPSVVTDRHVELTPAYKSGPKLRDGDLIPLDRTRTPVEIDRVIAVADKLAAELARTDESGKGLVKDGIDVLSANLKGNGGKIRRSIKAMASAIGAVTQDRDALTGLIENVDVLTAAAAKNDKTIRSFSQRLTTASELFAENSPEFGRLMKRINGLLDQADTLLRENRSTLRSLVSRARTTVGTLNDNSRELAEAVDTLPLTFQNLAAIVDPEKKLGRAHANLDDLILDTSLINVLCGRLGVQLPGCETGRMGDFGPDFGITEMLLGAVK